MSCRLALRESPKPGAFTAHSLTPPRSLLRMRVARASLSTSSATMTSGRCVLITPSRTGSSGCSLQHHMQPFGTTDDWGPPLGDLLDGWRITVATSSAAVTGGRCVSLIPSCRGSGPQLAVHSGSCEPLVCAWSWRSGVRRQHGRGSGCQSSVLAGWAACRMSTCSL